MGLVVGGKYYQFDSQTEAILSKKGSEPDAIKRALTGLVSRQQQDITAARTELAKANAAYNTALANSGLAVGATGALGTATGTEPTGDDIIVTGNVIDRVRISAQTSSKAKEQTYGVKDPASNVLSPLWDTDGLMFPYTPSIAVSQDVNWISHDLTHTNFDVMSYQRTPSASIQLTGKFTVQNQQEGEYAIAVIHFLRTVTKMYYGAHDSDQAQSSGQRTTGKAGLPPPTLLLRGYGNFMFNDLTCVVRGFNFTYEENMDTVLVRTQSGHSMYLPPIFTISVNIGLQNNMRRNREEFSLDDFRKGNLFDQGGWF